MVPVGGAMRENGHLADWNKILQNCGILTTYLLTGINRSSTIETRLYRSWKFFQSLLKIVVDRETK